MKLALLLLLLLGASLIQPLQASVDVSGTFNAQQSCPAYVSKNRRTNPDQQQLHPGQRYPIFQINRAERPDWYRITIEGAKPEARWVSHQCGEAKLSNSSPSPGDCTTPDQADSYKLALSWQPAFCETRPAKAECRAIRRDGYAARNFTLHGLWPNKAACGTRYGFCGEYKESNRPRRHCDYRPVPMAATTLQSLKRYMPSAAHRSCLQRHEWFKHGVCQTQWSADQYYELAMRLTRAFNRQVAADIMAPNIGQRIETRAFFEAVDRAFGAGAHRRLTLKCHGGKLKDLYINLPPAILPDHSLAQLIQQAEEAFSNRCGTSFIVDAVDTPHY